MPTPIEDWRWFGVAGHFVMSSRCLHHLHTRVGNYRISTVGDYVLDQKKTPFLEFETVGAGRLYETYVFRITGECDQCDPPCGQGEITDWSEIDSLPANDVLTAEKNHMDLCRKYAERED